MIEDADQHQSTREKLETTLPLIENMKIPESNKKELKLEISNIIMQFDRIKKRSMECMEFIAEIEPFAKDLDDSLKEIERVSSKVSDVLLDKPNIDVNLEILESEMSKIEVGPVFVFPFVVICT